MQFNWGIAGGWSVIAGADGTAYHHHALRYDDGTVVKRVPLETLLACDQAVIGKPQIFAINGHVIHIWPTADKHYDVRVLGAPWTAEWYSSYERALQEAKVAC